MLAELKRSFQSGSVVHAFLIHGDAGCGKKTLAMALSMALHCTGEGRSPALPAAPARACSPARTRTHVEVRTDKAVLPVKEIRDLIDGLSEKPYEGGRRTVILHEAEKMNEPAQNAFLKTLEEPDGQTVFFLLTAHPEALLPTIRSRCRPVYMPRLPEETIRQELLSRGQNAGARRLRGAPERGRARPRHRPLRAGPVLPLPGRGRGAPSRPAREGGHPQGLPRLEERRKPEDSLPFLEAMEAVLRDIVRVQSGLAPFDAQIEPELEEFARHFTIEGVACIMEEVVTVRKRVHAHVQWRSAAEPLLRRIVEGAEK